MSSLYPSPDDAQVLLEPERFIINYFFLDVRFLKNVPPIALSLHVLLEWSVE